MRNVTVTVSETGVPPKWIASGTLSTPDGHWTVCASAFLVPKRAPKSGALLPTAEVTVYLPVPLAPGTVTERV